MRACRLAGRRDRACVAARYDSPCRRCDIGVAMIGERAHGFDDRFAPLVVAIRVRATRSREANEHPGSVGDDERSPAHAWRRRKPWVKKDVQASTLCGLFAKTVAR